MFHLHCCSSSVEELNLVVCVCKIGKSSKNLLGRSVDTTLYVVFIATEAIHADFRVICVRHRSNEGASRLTGPALSSAYNYIGLIDKNLLLESGLRDKVP